MVATKARNSRMQNDRPNVASMRIIPPIVLNRLSPCRTQIVGTIAGGTMSPARTKKLITPFHRLGRRCRTYPTIAENTTITMTLPTVSTALLRNARRIPPSPVCMTAARFCHSCHCVGRVNPSWFASAGFFAAWSRTNTNGTRNTTKLTTIATVPITHLRVVSRRRPRGTGAGAAPRGRRAVVSAVTGPPPCG